METLTTNRALTSAFIAELKHESAKTNKLLAVVPIDTKADYSPHVKSMKLGRLALHVAELPNWISMTINTGELDLGRPYPRTETPANAQALVKIHEKCVADAITALENTDDEKLKEMWTLRNGEHIIFTLPKKVVLRDMCLNHLIHHRAQLQVYCRLLDVAVPGFYGPSADDHM
jgi:uncharacterized damage-inducible protein DinB